ncbi:MAG TPA: serine/threonine-protein kinase, partial [Byssovorax sp.]
MNPGDVVAERFEIERLAGTGGMGAVYRAKDRLSGEPVALKTLRADAGDFNRRFTREARVMMDLRHPAVVRYVAHGETSSGEQYLAMEWLEGKDLHARLREKGLTLTETLTMMTRVADALGAAHARGVIHRDIKPGNLFLVGDDCAKVKILDFGIAHQAAATRLATRTGAMLGTPGYMSPEQARGDRSIDARADVFSLGCVLYKCLTGRAPFAGEDLLAVAAKLLFEDPARVDELRPEVPRSIADLVQSMLSKTPGQRPANGAAVAAHLESEETIARTQGEVEAPSSRSLTGSITATEQRLVCVVLAAQPEMIDPDEATRSDDALAASWRHLSHGLAPFGAQLERLVDGSFVASLGGKASATDQAAQAARCAIAMRALLPRNAIALATGRGVLAGKIPLGDVIDRAAQMLREQRDDGETDGGGAQNILVDEVTAGLLDARFDLAPAEAISQRVPGKTSAGVSFLRGERDPLDSTRTLLGRPTPCIGRERELGMLDVVMNECFGEPLARAVVVTAAPGVGKSRLLHEFVRRVHQRGLGAAVWSSRGDPMSAGSPFGMLG